MWIVADAKSVTDLKASLAVTGNCEVTMVPTITQMSQIWDRRPETVTPVSITAKFSGLRFRHPFIEVCVIVGRVPRTDENGRQLKALLDYLLDGDVEAKDIYDALGTSSSTYYRRIKEADYPDAEELRRVSDRFGISYPDLQIRFGLMSEQEVRSYIESSSTTGPALREVSDTRVTTRTTHRTRAPKLSELKPRNDAPPL